MNIGLTGACRVEPAHGVWKLRGKPVYCTAVLRYVVLGGRSRTFTARPLWVRTPNFSLRSTGNAEISILKAIGKRMGRIGKLKQLKQFLLGLTAGLCWTFPAVAQLVTPTSGTGNVGTQVSSTGAFTVMGGTQQLNTLFHSFEDFSPETANVLFQLDGSQSTVKYVIGRVTGNNLSFIDGQFSLTGGNSPDLFLINPNGITFGNGSSLDLPGSFVASTAESVLFNDELEFSARNPSAAPLLTVSTPTGLQFGDGLPTPPTIEVINDGHTVVDNGFFALSGGGGDVGLRIAAQETLALIGPEVRLSGGIVSSTTGGQLHIGTPQAGTVGLSQKSGWEFAYGPDISFGDVTLKDRAIVDASGLDPSGLDPSSFEVGRISVSTQNLNISGGAMILAQNYGSLAAPNIQIDATGDVTVAGLDSAAQFASGILSSAFSSGHGSDVKVGANHLIVQDGGIVYANTFGSGQSGQVDIDVEETIQVVGLPQNPVTFFSIIGSNTRGSGNAGDVSVKGKQLHIRDGSQVSTAVVFTGTGNSGTLRIDISDLINIQGFNPVTTGNSVLAASTLSAGNAGDVIVNTEKLILREAGLIDSSTVASGNAGNVTVNATEEINISGFAPEAAVPATTISSAALTPNIAFQRLFGLPATPTGDGGNVQVTTSSGIVNLV
ncbi:MAG: filamentous hemagglutinin N-terminal domain-containing protein [Cyanobacteria bacterium P01_D01_bin.56]